MNPVSLVAAIFSWILDFMALPVLVSSQNSHGSVLERNNMGHAASESHTNMKFSNLSSTLEKLYEWEKKLYKEIKVLLVVIMYYKS